MRKLLVGAVRSYQATAVLEYLAERRFVEDGLQTGIHHLLTNARVLCPIRDQAPALLRSQCSVFRVGCERLNTTVMANWSVLGMRSAEL